MEGDGLLFPKVHPVASQPEDELKIDRAAGEIPGSPIGDDGLAIVLSGVEKLDCVRD